MASFGAMIDSVRESLSAVSTVESRVVVTVAVLVLALLLIVSIVPSVAGWRHWVRRDGLLDGPIGGLLGRAVAVVPTTIGEVVVRGFQIAIALLATVAVLVVWGQIEPLERAIESSALAPPDVGRTVLTVLLAGLVYILAHQYKTTIERLGRNVSWLTDHQREIVIRMGQLLILLFGGLIGLGVWGINPQGLLVGAGFLGIVVGLAARQTLGSLIAGFVLMFSRPFTIGDWVEIGGEEGIVTDITIINTRLENFDGEVVVIPNDRVSNQSIVNRSQRGVLRLTVDVGIDYDSDPEHASAVALAAIKDVDSVADAPPPQIIPKTFGDSAIVLEMRFWIDHPTPPRKWNAISGVVTSVKAAFDREGITIPFPQRALSGRAETGGFQGDRTATEATQSGESGED